METVVDGVTFLVAEGIYHYWTEGRFSFERWGRRHGSFALVIMVVAAVRLLLVVLTVMRPSRAAAAIVAALISVTALLKVITRFV